MVSDYVLWSLTPKQKEDIEQQRDAVYEFCLDFVHKDANKKFAK
jgi:hypothetical protein